MLQGRIDRDVPYRTNDLAQQEVYKQWDVLIERKQRGFKQLIWHSAIKYHTIKWQRWYLVIGAGGNNKIVVIEATLVSRVPAMKGAMTNHRSCISKPGVTAMINHRTQQSKPVALATIKFEGDRKSTTVALGHQMPNCESAMSVLGDRIRF